MLKVHHPLLHLSIKDDGIGLLPGREKPSRSKPGMGLLDIRERATITGGSCVIESSPSQGTEVRLEIPLPSPEAGRHKPSDKTTKKKNKAAPRR